MPDKKLIMDIMKVCLINSQINRVGLGDWLQMMDHGSVMANIKLMLATDMSDLFGKMETILTKCTEMGKLFKSGSEFILISIINL